MFHSISAYRTVRGWVAAIAAMVAVVAQPAAVLAQGCAMCKTMVGGPGDPLGVGINTSILFMMSMPFVMTGSVGAWIAYMYWRGGTSERDDVLSLTSPGEEVS
jgi:hypothetical protein